MSLKVAIEALHDDADMWNRVADTTAAAASAAEALTLSESELSWASRPTGLLESYEEIRAKVARLLDEGTTNFHAMAEWLIRVANAYQTNEDEATRRFQGVWDAK
jgi:hypothetical protein